MSQTTTDTNDERLAQLIERFAGALVRNLEAYDAEASARGNSEEEVTRSARSSARASRRRDEDCSDEAGEFFDEDCRPLCNHGDRHDRACCRRNRRRQETLEQMVLSLWFESRCRRREGVLGATSPQLMPEMVGDLLDIAADQENGVAGCLRRTGSCDRRDSGLAGIQQLEQSGCQCRNRHREN